MAVINFSTCLSDTHIVCAGVCGCADGVGQKQDARRSGFACLFVPVYPCFPCTRKNVLIFLGTALLMDFVNNIINTN